MAFIADIYRGSCKIGHGELAFRSIKLSIDLSVPLGNGVISKNEQLAAQRNLDIMRNQYKQAQQRVIILSCVQD